MALVMVTATVPAAGARQGDTLDCTVSSIGTARSLAGGTLFLTPLQGPLGAADELAAIQPVPAARLDSRVYAFAQGLAAHRRPAATVARIHKGCRLEEDFFNVFSKEDKITLVLDKNHADFQVAQDVAELINSQLNFQSQEGYLAKALNAVNIEVIIPPQYRDDPVLFISQVLSLPMIEPHAEARVVINERAGSVVIGGDVEIGSVVVTHKNVVDRDGRQHGVQPVRAAGCREKTSTAKLKSLVESLNAVKVPTEDIIDIIKGLERNGKLHGSLIIE